MRVRPILAAALLCAAPLAACGTTPAASPPSAASVQSAAQKAMLAAETAFNVAATAELDAKGTGILSGQNAVKADAIRKEAYQVLVGLRTVYAAGKTPDLGALLALTNQLLTLSGHTPAAVAPPAIPTL